MSHILQPWEKWEHAIAAKDRGIADLKAKTANLVEALEVALPYVEVDGPEEAAEQAREALAAAKASEVKP